MTWYTQNRLGLGKWKKREGLKKIRRYIKHEFPEIVVSKFYLNLLFSSFAYIHNICVLRGNLVANHLLHPLAQVPTDRRDSRTVRIIQNTLGFGYHFHRSIENLTFAYCKTKYENISSHFYHSYENMAFRSRKIHGMLQN